ncbi:hypothetical protein SERLA73DRAFT_179880 [Serpula lacrymans var. lacrymans S7.3]|uniref:Yeast cell wall synthesis Kre9/Knh1-like N-terminal domain-containing protein n=2 Tax=Serpula lacrymans var. lacrymans TaxID=341189 RepID=F8PUW0_SERL3|nr:uncharacterized protein SERLADRAFT_465198 [Serpula lacrymans var. lacrymans S7.9]EGN99724.1 hypothetical protein SERLA73DRAFT_179880 [Serpula lacrymans var. lacrymans S7.3]EGO25288.1 hypothetical protein SERLADRAFT_465198 [Serpula lacrymans var. lacrymans S7.9]
MISKTSVFALFFFLSTFFSFALALPTRVSAKRDVYVPPVISPNNATVWTVGQTYNVTWNTTNPPAQISNPRGNIYLRQGNDTLLNPTLASNFSMLAGSQEVTVPDVTPGSDYRIVLFGDSGDWSGVFAIAAASSSD